MIIIKDVRGEMIGIACQRWHRDHDDDDDDDDEREEGDDFVIPAFLKKRPMSDDGGSEQPVQNSEGN